MRLDVMRIHFTDSEDSPAGTQRVHVPARSPRDGRVVRAAEELMELGIDRVAGLSLAKAPLAGVAMDVWVAAGGDADDERWGNVQVLAGQRARSRERLVRVDTPSCASPVHGKLAGFGAAVELLGEDSDGGVSLVGLLRGAKGALAGGKDPVLAPGAVRRDGEPLLAEARMVVVSSLGLPAAIARWFGGGDAGQGDIRYWASRAPLGALHRLLDGDASVTGVLSGSLALSTIERFVLDGEVIDGGGLPVLIRPGPAVTLHPF